MAASSCTLKTLPTRRSRARAVLVAVTLATGLATITPAQAQVGDMRALADAVRRLEQQVATLQRDADLARLGPRRTQIEIDPNTPPGVAQLLVRLTEMEEVLRSFTGRLERLENDFARQASLTERQAADFDFRLRILEEGQQSGLEPGAAAAAPPPAALPPTASGPAALGPTPQIAAPEPVTPARTPDIPDAVVAGPTFVLPAGTPQEQYNYAYDFLLRGRYPDAQQAFQAFIIANPDSPLAGNSQYWLGETYYARGQFDAAARAFAQGFERYPDSDKVTHNLLKLGMSLAQLERPENACDTLDLLLEDYPQAPSSVRDRAERERTALPC